MQYTSDGGDRGEIEVRYGVDCDTVLPVVLGQVALGIGVYLAQLCLAERVVVDPAPSAEMVATITPLAEMLYDVRCWKDGRPLLPGPDIDVAGPRTGEPLRRIPLHPRRSTLLFSGGKDSTLSSIVLADNGYEVRPVHITANTGVDAAEQQAVSRLAPRLGIDVETVHYRHPQFREFSRQYATHWDSFPYCNIVPFGRDLLLAVLAAPRALLGGSGHISLGHDHDCRTAYLSYQDKVIPRNDVESVQGAQVLGAYLRRFDDGLGLLPPVATLSEFRILYEMLVHHPDLMAMASFCFWGRSCGRCAKCLRYYLAQRVLNVEVLDFADNPLRRGACPELEDILTLTPQDGVLFQSEVLYCLGRLAERGDIRPEEDGLRDFAVAGYPTVAGDLDVWESELMAEHPDPQVPPGFRAADPIEPVSG